MEGREWNIRQRGWAVGWDKIAKTTNVSKGRTQKIGGHPVVVAFDTGWPNKKNAGAASKGVADF